MKQFLKICTQCGAPLKGYKCEYCDTIYEDIEDKIASLKAEIEHLKSSTVRKEKLSKIVEVGNGTSFRWVISEGAQGFI